MHHDVGIGADHRQVARPHAAQRVGVVVRRLGRVVEQPGAQHEAGLLEPDQLGALARGAAHLVEQGDVAWRPDVEGRLGTARRDEGDRRVAGGDDAVVGRPRNAEPVELAHHRGLRPGRVGQQHHGPARLPEPGEGICRGREGPAAVVHDAPDVAERHVVERREVAQPFDDAAGQGHWGKAHLWPASSRSLPCQATRSRAIALQERRQGIAGHIKERTMSIKPLFTATATATGGRNGHRPGRGRFGQRRPLGAQGDGRTRQARHHDARAPVRHRLCGLLRRRARFRRQAAQEGCDRRHGDLRGHHRPARCRRLRPRGQDERGRQEPAPGRAAGAGQRGPREDLPLQPRDAQQRRRGPYGRRAPKRAPRRARALRGSRAFPSEITEPPRESRPCRHPLPPWLRWPRSPTISKRSGCRTRPTGRSSRTRA